MANIIARKIEQLTDAEQITIEWDGVYGGVGAEVDCNGLTMKVDGILWRGPSLDGSGKFVTRGYAWTDAYRARQAAKKKESDRRGRAAADTDRY